MCVVLCFVLRCVVQSLSKQSEAKAAAAAAADAVSESSADADVNPSTNKRLRRVDSSSDEIENDRDDSGRALELVDAEKV